MANRVVRVNVQRIKELAKAKNKTITQIENDASISNGAIRKWVNCDAQIDKLYRVADTLGTNIESLIERI